MRMDNSLWSSSGAGRKHDNKWCVEWNIFVLQFRFPDILYEDVEGRAGIELVFLLIVSRCFIKRSLPFGSYFVRAAYDDKLKISDTTKFAGTIGDLC